ncbi:hypothetical protein GC173_05360 [bacterium]|nr:hypothetical protein [bacterium]
MTQNEPPTANDSDAEPAASPGLPVDPRAILIGLWQLRLWLGGALIIALVLGGSLGKIFAQRIYTAETVLLYQAPPVDSPEAATIPSLLTLLNMVKLSANLETVRERLKLPVEIKALGAATNVAVQQKTTLVTITAKWEDPKEAAAIANTLREAFLENQTRLRREEAEARIADIAKLMEPVTAKLATAEEELRKFTSENRIVDLSQEARATLDELGAVNLLLEQARIDKKSIDLQVENTARIIADLQEQAEREQAAAAATSDAMSETNIRIQRLRESIMDDKEQRANQALLHEAELAVERARKNFEAGGISQSELDASIAEFNVIKARTVDTPEVAGWKNEIKELDKKVIPSQSASSGPTGNLLKDIMFRSFEIKLQQTTTNEKVASLEAAKKGVEARLEKMPDLHRTYATLVRNVEIVESQKKDLEARLAEGRRMLDASVLPFTLVSAAEPPIRSSSSNAKKIAALVVVLLAGAAFAVCLAVAVLEPRIRTGRELELAVRQAPLLAELTEAAGGAVIVPTNEAPTGVYTETVRAAARHLRTLVPKPGARILVVAAGHCEGTSTVTANLAMVFSNWDERVLIVDAHVRREESIEEVAIPTWWTRFSHLITSGIERKSRQPRFALNAVLGAEATMGLTELLSNPGARLQDAARPTALGRAHAIVRGNAQVSPDLLATARFADLMREATADYTLVLVDGPPSLLSVDAENIALRCDAVLLVVRGFGPHASAVRDAVRPFERIGVPVVATVLNKVASPFARGV